MNRTLAAVLVLVGFAGCVELGLSPKDATSIAVCQEVGRACKDAGGTECYGKYDRCMADAGMR